MNNPFSNKKERVGSILSLLNRGSKKAKQRTDVPENLFIQCPKCQSSTEKQILSKNLYICERCGYHFPIRAKTRLKMLYDNGEFTELNENLVGNDPISFPGYMDKFAKVQKKTGMPEAVKTAVGQIGGVRTVVGVLDNRFLMGSMGVAVGEKITRAVEYAEQNRLPLVTFSTSGGARMQEGIYSLMQMAKTAAAVKSYSEAGLLYISVMTNPTTGGVTASFATLGDIIIAEPGALIGFAGPRVIEQTIRQKLPDGFQSSENLLQNGFLDAIVQRRDLKDVIAGLLSLHTK